MDVKGTVPYKQPITCVIKLYLIINYERNNVHGQCLLLSVHLFISIEMYELPLYRLFKATYNIKVFFKKK